MAISPVSQYFQTSSYGPVPHPSGLSVTSCLTKTTQQRNHWVTHAKQMISDRTENPTKFVTSVLENMGFERSSASPVHRFICALHAGEIKLESVDKTSDLGRVLREFAHREKAFALIHRYGEDVSDEVLSDVAHPISRKCREKAERQISRLLQNDAEANPTMMQKIARGVSTIGKRILSAMDYLNTRILNLPGASAQEGSCAGGRCEKTSSELLLDDCSGETLKSVRQLVADSKVEIERELAKIKGKRVILLMGPTGAGKGVFINYLFSARCKSSTEKIICDKNPAPTADTDPEAKRMQSHTTYIHAYPVDEELAERLGENTVLIDTPGFYDKRIDPLESVIYSLLTSKSIHDIQEERHINVYLLDYPTFNAIKGGIIKEIKSIIEQQRDDAKAIVISKVDRIVQCEAAWCKVNVAPSRAAIREAFREEGYTEASIRNLMLYDVMDKELAESRTVEDDENKCNPGGGTKRPEILAKFKQMLDSANQSASNPYIVDPNLKNMLRQMGDELTRALKEGLRECKFDQFNCKYSLVFELLKIKHPALIDIRTNLISAINVQVGKTLSDIEKTTRSLLDSNTAEREPPLLEILHMFEKLMCLEKVLHPDIQAGFDIRNSIKEASKFIKYRCREKIWSILDQEAQFKNSQEKTKSAFLLIRLVDKIFPQIRPDYISFYKKAIQPELDKVLQDIEKGFYESLGACNFDESGKNETKFNKYFLFLENATANKFKSEKLKSFFGDVPKYYYRDLVRYKKLKDTYNNLVTSEKNWSLIFLGLDAALLVGTIAIPVAAPVAAAGAIARGLSAAAKAKRALQVITVVTTAATAGDFLYDTLSLKICKQAWVQENFAGTVKAVSPSLLPSWMKQTP